MARRSFPERLADLVFARRPLVLALFALVTLWTGYEATRLRIDAGFSKLLPLEHPYMRTFVEYRQEFGGANRVLIALMAEGGDIFDAGFLEALRQATDEVFFIPGVDRAHVRSIFTPNVRYTEVVEDGIAAGNVIPDDFEPTPAGLEQVRENVLKAGIVGRLVANDFSGALISAQLLEFDPATGEPLDYIAVARELEERIRGRLEREQTDAVAATHIIGFAKVIGDIADGAVAVVLFFLVAFAVTGVAVYVFIQGFRLTVILLLCSLVAVVWQLGLLTRMGFGIDPMGILVPFLVFAVAVSHGVQMASAARAEIWLGADRVEAIKRSFVRIVVPSSVALASDVVGFITILFIKIQVIREMAITASLGVALVILTNLLLLPTLLSYVTFGEKYRRKLQQRAARLAPVWDRLQGAARRRPALGILGVALVLLGLGAWKAADVKIGDLHRGVPELRGDSRYNRDTEAITEKFSIGVDVLTVIGETRPNGCVDHAVMDAVDRFAWHMRNVEGVHSVVDLPQVAKVINAGWNEGALAWRTLPRNESVLAQSVTYVPTDTGLLNADCSVIPVMIFTTDHKAETIEHVVAEIKRQTAEHAHEDLRFRLATGNVGVMAATNEEVQKDQFPILVGVFAAVIVMCWLTFRSLRAVLCIVIPLGLVSLLAYALMSVLEIGLKVNTLPVVALGVGIGVDYGIYIFSRFQGILAEGKGPVAAYRETLAIAGTGVVFTGLTLAAGVGTWIFSPLKFQADMGILLTFMFVVNMLGAILLLPALAAWLFAER